MKEETVSEDRNLRAFREVSSIFWIYLSHGFFFERSELVLYHVGQRMKNNTTSVNIKSGSWKIIAKIIPKLKYLRRGKKCRFKKNTDMRSLPKDNSQCSLLFLEDIGTVSYNSIRN